MKLPTSNSQLRTTLFLLFTSYLLVVTLIGCEAFVRKFTRKPKKENLPQEEIVMVPEEYKAPVLTKEQLYRQYFLFWKSWQDELITALSPGANHKKQIDCALEAIKNLNSLKALLNEERQKKIDVYINQLSELKELIAKDIYANAVAKSRDTAEQVKRNILRDFSYNKIKDYLL